MPSLKEYQRKRHFNQTPEPPALETRARGNSFVVQKHDATRLHYDFRLEMQGVLKSWAVPKGPSLNPSDKRLAMETEDHPLDYGGFEGVIPEGNYGAGPVSVWDNGTYEIEGDLPAINQYERGEIKFILHGQKLRGGFVLVKLRQPNQKGKPWLLIKHRDDAVDPAWNIDDHDGSVLSGRVLQEIEQGLPPTAAGNESDPGALEGARQAKMPAKIDPMLATLVDKPFNNPEWLFEIKWDGIRAITFITQGKIRVQSRTGRDITRQYPEVSDLPEHLHLAEAILDGEIVVLNDQGRSDFERLQSRMNLAGAPSPAQQRLAPLTYYAFDLLYANGYELRACPLVDRKRLLQQVLNVGGCFRYADHEIGRGKDLYEAAREQGLEGIIGKQAHSQYESGRSTCWVKFKVTQELEAVVGGYTAPRGAREHFGALMLGLYSGRDLTCIGSVGTGFTQKTQKEVFGQLSKLATTHCPFDVPPKTPEQSFWVEPTLVARVKYGNWTEERRLRAPVFLGLLQGRSPEDCRIESEIPVSAPAVIHKKPAVTGKVLADETAIERELLRGKSESLAIEIDGRMLQLTNLNKVFFPESGYTKRDLLAYYYRISEQILPLLKDRPMVLRRYPNGITEKAFFQKDAHESAPDWLKTIPVPSEEKKGETRYFVIEDRAGLLYLTNLGCIDHNPWASRTDDLERPDYFYFDLDPTDGTEFDTVLEVARAVLAKLQKLELAVFPKTSGATGFHLYVPVQREYTSGQLQSFADIVGRLVAAELPDLVTQQRMVAKRPQGRVLIDAYQNAYSRPLAAAYSVRAQPRAPVSCPVDPAELRRGLKPEQFNIKTIFPRLQKKGDLWADFFDRQQSLEEATERLSTLVTRKK
jgi:bifunctional non-homologous end joining protein LigD